jgi:hypothetical protein
LKRIYKLVVGLSVPIPVPAQTISPSTPQPTPTPTTIKSSSDLAVVSALAENVASLKALIVTLTNLVLKIQKTVKNV